MMKEAKNGYARAVEGFEQAFGPEHKYYLTALSNQAILMFQEVKMIVVTMPEEQGYSRIRGNRKPIHQCQWNRR